MNPTVVTIKTIAAAAGINYSLLSQCLTGKKHFPEKHLHLSDKQACDRARDLRFRMQIGVNPGGFWGPELSRLNQR